MCAVVLMPISLAAQTFSERAAAVTGEDFVRAFLGNCVYNSGDFQRLINAAEALGFTELPEEMRPILAPQDPNAEFFGFSAQSGEGAPYIIGLSRGELDGRTLINCAIANPYIETAKVVFALQNFLQVDRPSYEDITMGQRYRLWMVNGWSEGTLVSLMDAEPMGRGGATLTISAPEIN